MYAPTQSDSGAVTAALAGVLKTYGRERLELEFRLGQRVGTRFVPGVTEESWERLKAKMDASAKLEATQSCTKELIPGDEGAKYVDTPSGTGGYWMHKKRLHNFDMDQHGPWCCRVSMSLEVVNPPDVQGQSPADCKFERHKQRWSYVYRCWSIDLTKVASNLPHQLDNDGVSYEVEIELVDTAELFTRPMGELMEWGLRLVGDMCDMLAP